jgi:3-deoxy-D-manno-octulosonate 8-phosphate phosphatase (KDO 8-P phosphatase)
MTSRQPTQRFATEVLLLAQGMKTLFLDVDGVLTDGGLYYAECAPGDARGADETIKRFNTLDGYGIRLLKLAGVAPVVVTGRDSRSLRARLAALGVERAHFGVEHKHAVAQKALDEMGLDWSCAAAMGDDWPDLGLMRACAFCAAPSNAHVEVKAAAHFVTAHRGGDGAVRELADLLLIAGGHYAGLLEAQGE